MEACLPVTVVKAETRQSWQFVRFALLINAKKGFPFLCLIKLTNLILKSMLLPHITLQIQNSL